MSNEDYPLIEPHACYYLTFNVVDWVDIFIKPVFKQIIVESLNHFIEKRGLTVYAWCLMTNQLNIIVQAKEGSDLTILSNDFKKFTTKLILECIDAEPQVRRNWILKKFGVGGGAIRRSEKFQVWQPLTHPVIVDLNNRESFNEQLEYIHSFPVRSRIVTRAEEYLHSSARDYYGIKGLVNIRILDEKSIVHSFLSRVSF